ncbi:hypothetical protein WJX81_005828 [Elliptochloris bilobata]|uniref:Uncharacterized protein n=1 Tax=Elliptochloris bilobata TaxID=381761 RepID=A0AAW1SJ69_9CHLO
MSSAAASESLPLTTTSVDRYEEQLAAKLASVRQCFSGVQFPDVQVVESEREHYRMRAEFAVWRDKEDLYYVMYDTATREGSVEPVRTRVRVDQFPVGSRLLNTLMAEVMAVARSDQELKHKLFQVNFHTTLSGEAMVTMLYHRRLDTQWEAAAGALRGQLAACKGLEGALTVAGRSRKQKITLGPGHVTEGLHVAGRQLQYRQLEGAFSQPNAGVCQRMLEWAHESTCGSQAGDLLELYCGNGNFTVVLAENFRRVLATEVSKAAVAAAAENLSANSVANVAIARLTAEELSAAWRGERTFERLRQAGVDLAAMDFTTILVDPPRAGLDAATEALLPHFANVVYISCNPVTLEANLRPLLATHRVRRFAVFDQFPYTHHIECGAYLQRMAEVELPMAEMDERERSTAAEGKEVNAMKDGEMVLEEMVGMEERRQDR